MFYSVTLFAKAKNEIVVAADGTGDVKTITEAIQKLPMFNYGRVIIFSL